MQCAECKGKRHCGLSRCPVVDRFQAQLHMVPITAYSGSAPSVFIGSYGYPDVQIGPLMTDDSDLPTEWIAPGLWN